MNILPHKSWHVRTKANIERVRKDEEKAAEEEKERQRKIALAEQEARTDLLRVRAKKRHGDALDGPTEKQPKIQPANESDAVAESDSNTKAADIYTKTGHINFFQDAEAGEVKSGTNKEHEEEKRAEKEKWEKDIGLLTYLGQSAVEAQEKLPWYLSKRDEEKDRETDASSMDVKDKRRKDHMDPLIEMSAYVSKKERQEKLKDIYTDKHTDNTVEKYKDKSIEKYKDKHVELYKETFKDKHKDKSIETYKDKHIELYKEKFKDSRHKDKHKEKYKDKREDKQKEKHKKKHKDKHKNKHKDKYKEKHQKHKHKKKARRSETPDIPERKHSTATKTIQELRAERLRREQEEKKRADALLLGNQGQGRKAEVAEEPVSDRDRGYNSVFNPEFSRKRKRRPSYDDDTP